MSKVRFNLKNQQSKKSTLIMATFCYKGNRIRISTELSIYPKYWNKNNDRARETYEFKDGASINERLNQISGKINTIYNGYLLSGYFPTKEEFKEEIKEAIHHKDIVNEAKSFWDYYEDFIEFKNKQLNDIRDYNNSLRKHLKKAEKNYGRLITFKSIKDQQNGFMDAFNEYLHHEAKGANGSKGLSLNTIGKQHKNLKVFLNWCFDKGIIERFSIKHIVSEQEEIESIYLTKEELKLIINYPPSSLLEKTVKDLFIIGCETGLRFSDFTSLNKNHIRNNQIHIRPKKTRGHYNNKVIIPISSIVQSIIKQYNGEFPSFNNYRLIDFNKTIREIAKKLNIEQQIQNHRKINGQFEQTTHLKWQLISSHTCRRTFCTLKFLDGMPSHGIMKFSGHKTERAFMRYLRLDSEVAAVKYESFF